MLVFVQGVSQASLHCTGTESLSPSLSLPGSQIILLLESPGFSGLVGEGIVFCSTKAPCHGSLEIPQYNFIPQRNKNGKRESHYPSALRLSIGWMMTLRNLLEDPKLPSSYYLH
jgi:hypothetical protein